MRVRSLAVAAVTAAVLSAGVIVHPQTPSPAADTSRTLLDQYCVTCHNVRTIAGELALDTADPARISQNPELWEKVVRKLRARAMPPAGVRRPDERGYERLRLVSGRRARSARRNNSGSRPDRYLPSPDAHRVPERDPRPPRRRRRCHRAAAERRCELRLRQRERCRSLADAGRALSHAAQKVTRLAVGSPAAGAGRARGDAAARPHAGRSRRRTAVRHARRHRSCGTPFRATATTRSRSAWCGTATRTSKA